MDQNKESSIIKQNNEFKNNVNIKTISEYVKELKETKMFVHLSLEQVGDLFYSNVGYFFTDIERTLHCEAGNTLEYLTIEFTKKYSSESMKAIDEWIKLVERYGIEDEEKFMFDIARVQTSLLNGVIG